MAAPRRATAPRKRARTALAVTSAADIEDAPSFTNSEVAQVSASSITQTAIRARVAVLSWPNDLVGPPPSVLYMWV